MSTIRAKVVSNSSEDEFARVRISCIGFSEESDLIESVGSIPLKVGDIVYVDITNVHNPLILGKSQTKYSEYSTKPEGSVLFESSDGENYTIAYVKNNKFVIETNKASVKIEESKLTLEMGSSKIEMSDGKVDINNGALTIE